MHGTSIKSAANILIHGFENNNQNWYPSFRNHTYFITLHSNNNKISTENIDFAVEESRIAAANQNAQENNTAIICLEISEEQFDEYFTPDYSCNCDMIDCYSIETKKLNALIKNNVFKLTVRIAENSYDPMLRILFMPSNHEEFIYPGGDKTRYIVDMISEAKPSIYEHIFDEYHVEADLESMPILTYEDALYNYNTVNMITAMQLVNEKSDFITVCVRNMYKSDEFIKFTAEREHFIDEIVKHFYNEHTPIKVLQINTHDLKDSHAPNMYFINDTKDCNVYNRMNMFYERNGTIKTDPRVHIDTNIKY